VIVCDTGPLVAAALSNDSDHQAYEWIRTTRHTNESLPLGTTDASVVAVAERLGLTDVATLARRHFTVVRPRHVDALTLLP
jgi:predicted nucleic acid-binding protein